MIFVDELFTAQSRDTRAFFVGTRTGHQWCHMWQGTFGSDREELHRMAAQIGLKRGWFQEHYRTPHYDLTPNKRSKALNLGAIEMDARAWALTQKILS